MLAVAAINFMDDAVAAVAAREVDIGPCGVALGEEALEEEIAGDGTQA